MKRFSAACIVSVVLIMTTAGLAGAAVIDVYPVGDPSYNKIHPFFYGAPCTEDVYNVQNAIFAAGPGDTVVLHAENTDGEPTPFEFGNLFLTPSCVVAKSLTITGEGGGDPATGSGMTKIENGAWPFFISKFSEAPSDTDVEISHIHFHNAAYAAIAAFQCRDFAAIGNRITAETMAPDRLDPNSGIGFGILLQGLCVVSHDIYPDYIHGRVTIQDNYINLEEIMPTAPTWPTMSIWVVDTIADIDINGNQCLNDTSNGIGLIDNTGVMWVDNNYVELGVSSENEFTTHGIMVVQQNLSAPKAVGNAFILDNDIVCQGPKQIGIELANSILSSELGRSSIENNFIHIEDNANGIFISGVDKAHVTRNIFTGNQSVGIILIGNASEVGGIDLEFGPVNKNVIVRNDFSMLDNYISPDNVFPDVILGDSAYKNKVICIPENECGLIIDNGTHNIIVGCETVIEYQSPPPY